jgi:hypothetical protein
LVIRNSPFAREPACQKILDFVADSRRGVCSPRAPRRSESSAARPTIDKIAPDASDDPMDAAEA